MPLRLLLSGVIDHVLELVSIWLIDRMRRTSEPRTLLAANDHCRSGPPPTMPSFRGNAESMGSDILSKALRWLVDPDVSVQLSWWAQSPGKPLMYRFAKE